MTAQTPGRPLPIAVSMGDPAGIGFELALMAWRDRSARGIEPFYILSDPDALAERAARLGHSSPLAVIDAPESASEIFSDSLPVIPVRLTQKVLPGIPDTAHAPAIIRAIELAVEAVVMSRASAVVTCPIAKATLASAGFAYPGHTEFLGALAQSHFPGRHFRPVMMLASDELRVVPLTVHIPLSQVASALTRAGLFETVRTTWDSLKCDFGIASPRIAVSGLNPHAGESGTMGREELDIIAPAIAELRQEGLAVTGPHPADTLFHGAARASYDAAIAMFHDQALIAIKTIAFDRAVNVTLGLPFVRTSPDHGTAFDIAGQGVANPESFIQALLLASQITKGRTRTDKAPR